MDNFRKHFSLKGACAALLPAFAVCTLVVFNSCSGKKSGTTKAVSEYEPLVVDSVEWTHSTRVSTDGLVNVSLRVDFPVDGSDDLMKNLNEWIACNLGASDTSGMYAPATYLVSRGEFMLDSIAQLLKEDMGYGRSVGDISDMTYEIDNNISRVYQTDKFVTYGALSYEYMGGAHGSTSFMASVFRISDGTRFGYNMFKPTSVERVRRMVTTGLRNQYFKSQVEETGNMGLLVPEDSISLPVCPPYFLNDGVHFIYQQYEIAPYAVGMPECTIPYDSLRTDFIPIVRKLLFP